MTKTHDTKTQDTKARAETERPSEKTRDLQIAREVHTLNQMIYGQLAYTHPWATPFVPPDAFSAPVYWPPSAVAGPTPGWGSTPPWTC